MPLTPLDIHNKEFRRAFRGYCQGEVDRFLDEVAAELEKLIRQNARLEDQLGRNEGKLEEYRSLEESLQNALVVAQKTAEEVKANARKEAELIIRQAELEAERLLEEARSSLVDLRRGYQQLKNEMRLFRTRMRTLLQGYMELLEEGEGEAEGDILP